MGTAIWVFIQAVVGYGSAGAGWYWVGVQVARIAILAFAAKAFSPKVDLSSAAREKLLTVRDSIYPQAFVYGQDMLSGPLIIANTTGNENKFLTMAIALTGHEVDSVVEYRLDDTTIPLTDITGGTETGLISGGKFAAAAEVSFQFGTATQTEDVLLDNYFAAKWTVNHRLRGWSYMAWTFEIIPDNTAFETGAPQNIKAVIRGKKVYDPRLDSTNGGAGAHRLANSATWEWSDNPALCLADFILDARFGMQEDSGRIDWPMIIIAANVCDELVPIPTAATQKRYTCNATFRSDERRSDVRDALLQSMMGRMVFSQGVWRIWAGKALTADVTLTENNLGGEIIVQANSGAKERYNRVRGKFIDPSRDYSASTYPEQRSPTYEAEDGGEVRSIVADFLATNNTYEAQRNAIIVLKQSRQQRVVSFAGNMSCFRIQPGSVVTLTIDEYGFAGEKFFVTEWSLGENGVSLTMLEELDSAWANPAEGEYSVRSPTGVLDFVNQGVPAPTNFTVEPVVGGVLACWVDPPLATFKAVEVWMAYENVRGSATLIGSSPTKCFYDLSGEVNRIRYYWIRSVNQFGTVSEWLPNLTTTTYTSFPIVPQPPVVADPYVRLGAGYWSFTTTGGGGTVSYLAGAGTKGTDVIRFEGSAITLEAAHLLRRGPDTWDVEAIQGMTIEIRYRIKYAVAGTGVWTTTVKTFIRTSDAIDADIILNSGGIGGLTTFDETSTLGEWVEKVHLIELSIENLKPTKPRYIQVLMQMPGNINGAEYYLDMLDATISGRTFNADGESGYVPKATAAEIAALKVLQADGAWVANAGGGGGGTVTSSGVPLNNEVAVFTTATDIDSDASFTYDGTTLEATQFAGIAKANLLDKSATEIITLGVGGSWTFTGDGSGRVALDLGTDLYLESNDGTTNVIVNHNNADFRYSTTGARFNAIPFYVTGFLDFRLDEPIKIKEQATADPFVATYGQLWVKTATPNELWFSDDAGTDFQLSGGAAGTVTASGAPLNDQIAVFTSATDIDSDAALTYSVATGLVVDNDVSIQNGNNFRIRTTNPLNYMTAQGVGTTGYSMTSINLSNFQLAGWATVQVQAGAALQIYAANNVDNVSFTHDGVDLNIVGTATADINITGVTSIQAGTVDADFDLLTATNFNGVPLTTGGVATNFLNATGAYSAPPDSGLSAINTQNAAYTLVIGDAGKTIRKATSTASITHTIPSNASVAFPIGTLISWQNDGTVNMSIAITTDTLTDTEGNTGTRVLGPNDTAVIQKVAATSWKYAATPILGAATTLSTGTVTATSYGITSDGGADDVILASATGSAAGVMPAAKFNEVVANTAKVTNATHTGDVTGSAALTIAADAVTYAKMQNVVTANRLLGSLTAGGIVTELTGDQVRTMLHPTVAGKTASYQLVLADQDDTIRFTGATASKVCTIPANGTVAFPIGTYVGITNDGTVNMTVAITTDTLTWGKDNTTGTRTLAPGADCVIFKTTATTWKINGSALVT